MQTFILSRPFHMCNANTHGSLVRLQTFDAGQLLDSPSQAIQSFSCEVGAGDVFEERAQVDTRVLFGVAVRRYFISIHIRLYVGRETHAMNGSHQQSNPQHSLGSTGR